jgi:acyl carrier protein
MSAFGGVGGVRSQEGAGMSFDAARTGFADELLKMINAEISLDPSEEITLDTDLLLTGLVDSLGVVQVVAWIEDRLGMDVDPVDVVIENFQTVAKMVAFAARSTA